MKRSKIAVSRDRLRIEGDVDGVESALAMYVGWDSWGKGSDETP
jgi:hypothetical protein